MSNQTEAAIAITCVYAFFGIPLLLATMHSWLALGVVYSAFTVFFLGLYFGVLECQDFQGRTPNHRSTGRFSILATLRTIVGVAFITVLWPLVLILVLIVGPLAKD